MSSYVLSVAHSCVGGHLEYKKAWFWCVTENGLEYCSENEKLIIKRNWHSKARGMYNFES